MNTARTGFGVGMAVWLGAASLAGAAPLPFRGEMSFALPSLGVFAVVEGSGIAQVNGDGTGGPLTSLALPAGAFVATASFPGSPPIGEVLVTAQNGAGAFSLTASGGGGSMPLLGAAQLCFNVSCSAAGLFLTLPLDVVGAGGMTSRTGFFSVELEGALWTKGNVTITWPGAVTLLSGYASGPAGLPGSEAQAGGRIGLVTPVAVRTNLPGFEEIPAFGVLDIRLVPEPRASLLIGLGLGAFALGRRRRALVLRSRDIGAGAPRPTRRAAGS